MNCYDVLIVGGGPAGSSCAWALRHSGLKVAILDKQIFPRDKVCGGWITPPVLTELEIDPEEYAAGRVFQPITSFRIGAIGSTPVDIDCRMPVSYGIRRREFDDFLLKRCGAELLLGAPLKTLERWPEGWIVNQEIQARVLIGAGGHFCPIARRVGAKAEYESAVVAQEAEFVMDASQLANCQVRGDTPELYFCADMRGYGWCFRKGDVLNIGLGRADLHRLSSHVHEFLGFLKSTGRISFDPPAPHGHAYLLYGDSTRDVAGDGYLLVGDAAGLAYSQSGEGILPAIQSGLLAASRIVAGDLGSYRGLLEKKLGGSRYPWLEAFGRHLPPQLISSLAHRLVGKRWFAQRVVVDQWFLHAA
ncbi:MAG: FAD-dependent oxidoreductase [Bryobacteraceae bacterium]|jgi:geranylgeranyl reductase family protein